MSPEAPPGRWLQRLRSYRLPTTATAPFCPSEVTGTISVPPGASGWQKFCAYAGTGLLVSIGYIDPGNWATDIEAGSRFGYGLLCMLLLSSLIAMLLQSLCVRVGVATGADLATLCHLHLPRRANLMLWLLAEVAIVACDVAEVLGTALAFKLLLNISLSHGIVLTALDTVVVLALQGRGVRRLEAIVLVFLGTVGLAYGIELFLVAPDWMAVAGGFWPDVALLRDRHAWYLAVGIMGATVMPHNLYLHTALIQTRVTEQTDPLRREAVRYGIWDTVIALSLAFFINAAILVLAGAAFHMTGHHEISDIQDAHRLLQPILGTQVAAVLFAVALLAAGQSSTLTGTLAGQIIMEGFLQLRIPCWQRRLITRVLAVVPAWLSIAWLGEDALGQLLVLSQVVLSLQLPFAVVPLILFASSSRIMRGWPIGPGMRLSCWTACTLIVAANAWFLLQLLQGR